jgi:cytochrome bd-type quinol oxidase subunit 2
MNIRTWTAVFILADILFFIFFLYYSFILNRLIVLAASENIFWQNMQVQIIWFVLITVLIALAAAALLPKDRQKLKALVVCTLLQLALGSTALFWISYKRILEFRMHPEWF